MYGTLTDEAGRPHEDSWAIWLDASHVAGMALVRQLAVRELPELTGLDEIRYSDN